MSVLSCDEVRDLAAGFVLGALDPAAMHDVRDHLATCPEAHPEMHELGGVVPYLAESVEPVEPPTALGGRITRRDRGRDPGGRAHGRGGRPPDHLARGRLGRPRDDAAT